MTTQIRSGLELLYFVSGVVVAIGVIYGLKQIALLKKDIRLRNERAAKEKAIEYGRKYLRDYVDLQRAFFVACQEAKLAQHSGPVGDFTSGSILGNTRIAAISTPRYGLPSWLPAMNELEALSASFISGVADEGTGFKIFGRSFCETVESNYDLVALSRSNDSGAQGYWQNIVELYRLWSPRLEAAELRRNKDSIEAKIAALAQDARISPIGTE
jgi:hypothetical protein